MTADRPEGEPAARPKQSEQLTVTVLGDETVHVSGIPANEVVDRLQRDHGDDRLEVSGDETAPQRDYDLSDQEFAVMRLIASGLTNQDIADRMFLSINTVKSYIRSAYRKVNVKARTQAVIWAYENGLANLDSPILPEEL